MKEITMMQAMPNIGPTFRGINGLVGGQGGVLGGEMVQLDGFGMLLQQLLGDTELDFAAMMQQMQSMERSEEEEGAKTAMELMAQMLFAVMPTDTLAEIPADDGRQTILSPEVVTNPALKELFRTSLPAEQVQEAFAGLKTVTAAAEDSRVVFAGLETLTAATEHSRPVSKTESSFTSAINQMAASAETRQATQEMGGEKKEPKTEGLLERFEYQSTVQQVQKNLRNQPKQAVSQETDVERLQADVDMKKFMPAEIAEKITLPQPVADDLVEQFKSGVLENLKLGKDEFVLELKPEGLGEITIKMQEKDGKVLLSILTSTPQVARALNQEVAALQNSLKPLRAQVQEITAVQDFATVGQYTAFTGQQKQFTQQNQEQPQTRRYFADLQTAEVQTVMRTPPQLKNDAALDAYI